jgi:hypothetical protein
LSRAIVSCSSSRLAHRRACSPAAGERRPPPAVRVAVPLDGLYQNPTLPFVCEQCGKMRKCSCRAVGTRSLSFLAMSCGPLPGTSAGKEAVLTRGRGLRPLREGSPLLTAPGDA